MIISATVQNPKAQDNPESIDTPVTAAEKVVAEEKFGILWALSWIDHGWAMSRVSTQSERAAVTNISTRYREVFGSDDLEIGRYAAKQ